MYLYNISDSDYVKLVRKIDKYERKLNEMKLLIDAVFDDRTLLTGNGDSDYDNHIYDIDAFVGVLRSIVYESLGIDIPSGKRG